jgi:hypothetical protein
MSHGAPYMCEYYVELHVQDYVIEPVRSHWCHGVVALWRQVIHDLEVGYVGFIINACAGCNPRDRSTRVHIRVTVNSYIITR